MIGAAYTTADAASLAAFVTQSHDLPSPVTCALLNRGFNDVFAVRTATGERCVLRLSNRRRRTVADVAAEMRFLAYLDAHGAPVAAPVPTRDGALLATAVLPEGKRAAVLLRHIAGASRLDDAETERLAPRLL